MKICCLLLLSILFFPLQGNSENIKCNFSIKEGLRKIQDKANPVWFATARATFELDNAESIEIARSKAELKAFMILASELYGYVNKETKRILGGKITNVCISKNSIYVEVKIDSESIKQAESVKSMSTSSLSDNPTPRSTSDSKKTADSDTSELEDIVRGMHLERK